ncbi:MAG: acyl-CoA dehydrogenase family protein, partial [Candidatus Marinimicrobia bacterium]|nr:acyl-CoA dehydrogenase family protein [Candidatus Neomarinimicrobiota bacterium]
MKYIGPDFYNITNLLTEEELAIQKTAHDFVKNEFMPIIQDHFRDGTFPTTIIPRLGEIGVFGSTFPEEFGGAGVSNVAYGLLMQELERGDSGLRSFASVQGGLVMYPILEYGSDEQKNNLLPKLASGEKIGCFGLTEPEFGSNPGGMITRAKHNGDDWILNGSKMWITNGTIADIAIVWAKDEDDVIRGFIVPHNTPGF